MKRQFKRLPDSPQRVYLPDTFKVRTWKSIEPYFKELSRRAIADETALKEWLLNRSEIYAIFKDDLLLRQVQTMQNQQDEQLKDSYRYALLYMLPRMEAHEYKLNKRFLELDLLDNLGGEYQPYIEKVKRDVALYNKKNAESKSELTDEGYGYEQKISELRNQYERQLRRQSDTNFSENIRVGKEKNFREWTNLLQEEETYFESLLENLLKKRQQIAERVKLNDFDAYQVAQDFRRSYGITEIEHLHNQVHQWVVPLLNELLEQKKERLGVSRLRPWDLDAYSPYTDEKSIAISPNELLDSTQACLDSVYPPFAEHLQNIATYDLMDLSPRPNKAKREYLSSFYESRYSFLSMNARGMLRDLQLLSKQTGEAMQAYHTSDIRPHYLKKANSEIKDLAGYSLELFAMHHWPTHIFSESKVTMQAQAQMLETCLLNIVRLTIGDIFQRWLHTHPNHSREERETAWLDIHKRYFPDIVDWTGLEELRASAWFEEYRLFQAPERYLQQILARLGSFATWRDYRAWPLQTLQRYLGFLKQGGRQEVEESFASLGLHLAYQDDFIEELMRYIKEQMKTLQN